MSKNSGFVLIAMLMILSILSLGLLYALSSSIEEKRLNYNAARDLRLSQVSHDAFSKVYQSMLKSKPHCVQAVLSDVSVLSRPSSWWLMPSHCRLVISTIHLTYYLSPLQQDACVQVAGESADYWQVTMRAVNKLGYKLISQRTLVLPIKLEKTCQGARRKLSQHWQSWRELT